MKNRLFGEAFLHHLNLSFIERYVEANIDFHCFKDFHNRADCGIIGIAFNPAGGGGFVARAMSGGMQG